LTGFVCLQVFLGVQVASIQKLGGSQVIADHWVSAMFQPCFCHARDQTQGSTACHQRAAAAPQHFQGIGGPRRAGQCGQHGGVPNDEPRGAVGVKFREITMVAPMGS